MHRAARLLQSEITVYAACALSFALGVFFIFVWAPHPWGWEGFDHYHELALELAAGRPFPTLDVPWGYAYFLAFFYRLFGDHPGIPLTVQAAANASIPWLTYRFASTWLDRQETVAAALLTGLFSFNTVYASTQSSDAVCTWIFMVAVLCVAAALRTGRAGWHAAAGALLGLAAQFRPNLILLPVALAGFAVVTHTAHRWRAAILLVSSAAVMLTPWVVRNYRLTRDLLPTSVHGGVQLWYGTLQVGPYRDSRAYNPRSVFEAPALPYTSLAGVPILVSAAPRACAPATPERVSLIYWTDRAPAHLTLAARHENNRLVFEIPAPRTDAVVYYYLTASWGEGQETTTPAEGAGAPFVCFVTQDHLGDQDVHGDLIDVFDLVRAARAAAWHEPVNAGGQLVKAGVTPDDPEAIAAVMASDVLPAEQRGAARVAAVDVGRDETTLRLGDGSRIVIPREWRGRITDLTFEGAAAQALMHAAVRAGSLAPAARPSGAMRSCLYLEDIEVNDAFYRREPHLMRRYSALAWDNIRRDPIGFAAASAFRALRLFVVFGTDDARTAQQFKRSRLVYIAATVLSALYAVVFAAGVIIARVRRRAIALPLLLVLYVPATIAPVLTNMRYTVTTQPVMFCFAAVALAAASKRV